ncbi:MAG TPA: FtsX-like permease family protein [Anaeromyxobacteraceae bacterium]|nr:FtsX-like permease family protein [Anaeromyxobacteraceae bacterium]
MTVLLRIASRSVRKNWRHSLGAALAVAVGFAAITLFDGYLADFEGIATTMMEEQFMMGTVLVEKSGATAAMNRNDWDPAFLLGDREQAFLEEHLRARGSEVVVRVRNLFASGVASNGRASTQFLGWGYDPPEGAALRRHFAWNAWYGRPLQESGPDSVLLARGLGALLECAPATDESPFGPGGRMIPKARPFECRRPRVQLMGSTGSGQVNAVTATVAGLADGGRTEMDTTMVFMPLALAQRLRNTTGVTQYGVLLADPSKAAAFVRELSAAARARGLAIDAIPWQESYHGAGYRQGMGLLRAFRGMMAIVVVAIAGMAVFSTMVKLVSERTREIGTLRSLGFLRGQVTRLFALEAALLSAGACAAGLLVTLAVTALVGRAGITYNGGILAAPIPLGVALDPANYLRAALFLVAVAVFAAWLPARRAARARIPDALAYA